MKYKILSLLKQSSDYLSGETLSQKLNITRSAIWKYMKSLKEDGYEIDSVTNKGYRLISSANAFNAAELESGLNTLCFGQSPVFLKAVDSTNDEVKRLAKQNALHGLLVVAQEQTKGKGRLGRQWSSPPKDGMWFSLLLRPDLDPFHVPGITLAAGLGVCKALRAYTGCNAQIKWPNDVIIGRKKICGILTEMNAEADKINYAVVGIGINVNTVEFPAELSEKATSLFLETGRIVSRTGLLQEVLYHLEIALDEYMLNPELGIWQEYRELCATLGRTVSTTRNGKEITGTAKDITPGGGLIIETSNGCITVSSGEVLVQGIY